MRRNSNCLTAAAGMLALTLVAGIAQTALAGEDSQSSSYTNQQGQVVTPDVVRAAVQSTVGSVSSRVSSAVGQATSGGGARRTSALNGQSTGLAAGDDADRRIGTWVNITHTWLDKNDPGGKFDSGILSAIAGADYRVTDQWVVGLTGTIERSDVSTKFNNGRFDGTGFLVTPYTGYRLTDNIHADLLLGYGYIDYDAKNGLVLASGSTAGNRYFGNASINGEWAFDRVIVGGNLGWLQAYEIQDGYDLTNGTKINKTSIRLGQIYAGGSAGYLFETSFGTINPYLGAKLEYDALRTPGTELGNGRQATNDAFGTTFSLGVNSDVGDNLTLSVEGTTTQFRQNLDQYTISGWVRYRF